MIFITRLLIFMCLNVQIPFCHGQNLMKRTGRVYASIPAQAALILEQHAASKQALGERFGQRVRRDGCILPTAKGCEALHCGGKVRQQLWRQVQRAACEIGLVGVAAAAVWRERRLAKARPLCGLKGCGWLGAEHHINIVVIVDFSMPIKEGSIAICNAVFIGFATKLKGSLLLRSGAIAVIRIPAWLNTEAQHLMSHGLAAALEGGAVAVDKMAVIIR